MSAVTVAEREPGVFVVNGELGFETVPSLLAHDNFHFRGRDTVRVDLGEVQRTDSAGLALLVRWMREARRSGVRIVFVNVPEQMLAIARVSGFDRLLPMAEA